MDETIDFYSVLNLNKDATFEDIKKSYRKLALRYHPDKSPNSEEQFRLVNQAYKVLSDPRNKRIYDRYGIAGLNMVDSLGPSAMLLDPEIESILLAFFMLVSLLLICFLLELVFICLKVDRAVDWSWQFLFIPIWIADGLVLWITFYRIKNNLMNQTPNNNREEEQEELLNTGKYKKKPSHCQYLPLIELVLIIAFQVLIVGYLDNYNIHLPYTVLPYYGYEIVHTFTVGKRGWIIRSAILIQLTCIVIYHNHWSLLFIPIYFLGIFYAIKLWKQYKQATVMADQQLAQQAKLLVLTVSIIYGVSATLFYTVLGLIIVRLEGAISIRLSLILIPVFVVMGIVLCCTGCCLPCMLIASSFSPEQDIVDPNRRITSV